LHHDSIAAPTTARVVKLRPRLFWSKLGGTFWFVPGTLVVAGVLLGVVLVEVSARMDSAALQRFPRLFGASAESARGMLTAIAGSMITVAGVTFSITMVAVTQASTQYTPRILRNFMRDRPSQVVLGGLTGVFTYCIVVLRTIRSGDDFSFVPSIAVLAGFVLAGVGIILLIFFIHHISSALQASTIITRIADDTIGVIRVLFPHRSLDDDDANHRAMDRAEVARERRWIGVPARRTGYVQQVDRERLAAAARDCDIVLRLDRHIGDFVIRGRSIASAACPGEMRNSDIDALADAVDAALVVGRYRTIEQDPQFGIRQIADIALKALSPGINDPTTAVTCVDFLTAVLLEAAARPPNRVCHRESGAVRVIDLSRTFDSMLEEGIGEIRRYAEGHVGVLARLVDAIDTLAAAVVDDERRDCLRNQLARIQETVIRTVRNADDRRTLMHRVATMQSIRFPDH
jgi:uncharacterized membrane protein